MKIGLSRRSFLVGASALSFTGCALPKGAAERPNLSFGVLNDIHITDRASTEVFRKTLAFFRDQKVDAVMIVGDMADHGLVCQLQNVADAWYDVFPDDRAPDGRKVEKLFVYGNHDFEGLAYRDAQARAGRADPRRREARLRRFLPDAPRRHSRLEGIRWCADEVDRAQRRDVRSLCRGSRVPHPGRSVSMKKIVVLGSTNTDMVITGKKLPVPGKTCAEAIAFAQKAAGISVTRPGAQSSVPFRNEL